MHSKPTTHVSQGLCSLNRRTLLKQVLAASATLAAPASLHALDTRPTVRITTEELAPVPASFTGLSYESAQLSHPLFFSAENHDLIQFFRTLGPHGVLRLGGNLSEFTVWDSTNSPVADPAGSQGPDPGFGSNAVFPITPRAIDHLIGFLDATGWRLIYGLNLARGKVTSAVEEAAYVAHAAGDRLIALQFGNEPDLFKHADNQQQRWTYEEFIARWNQFYEAVHAHLPHVPIAGPDTSDPRWNAQFAQAAGHKVVLQTSHFYAEGPPTDPRMNIDFLLHPGERLKTYVMHAIEVSRTSGIPYRMAEGNTCYAAGKAGVSDTFASALWAVDFMLTVAQAGATGVNLHGGGNGLYTPIAGSAREGFTARPIYYGMLLVRELLGGTLLRTHVEGTTRNVAAYAARRDRTLQLVLLNREPEAVEFQVVLPSSPEAASAPVWRMQAPSISSTTGVTLAHANVTAKGHFTPAATETVRLSGNTATLRLAPYSAVLVPFPLN